MCGDTVCRGADGIIVVYDITNQESFHHVDDWMREIQVSNSLALLEKKGQKCKYRCEFRVKIRYSIYLLCLDKSAKVGILTRIRGVQKFTSDGEVRVLLVGNKVQKQKKEKKKRNKEK